MDRRQFVGAVVAGSVGLAGCSGGGAETPEGTDVVAGPNSNLIFEPAELTVSVGETVTWYFASSGHNVCGDPADHDEVSVPDDAEPFSSYDGNKFATVEQGDTYEHAFETAGDYHYVCIPHAPSMSGTIHVEK